MVTTTCKPGKVKEKISNRASSEHKHYINVTKDILNVSNHIPRKKKD